MYGIKQTPMFIKQMHWESERMKKENNNSHSTAITIIVIISSSNNIHMCLYECCLLQGWRKMTKKHRERRQVNSVNVHVRGARESVCCMCICITIGVRWLRLSAERLAGVCVKTTEQTHILRAMHRTMTLHTHVRTYTHMLKARAHINKYSHTERHKHTHKEHKLHQHQHRHINADPKRTQKVFCKRNEKEGIM